MFYNLLQAQTYEKDWEAFSKKMEGQKAIVKEYEAFETKHEKSLEKDPDNAFKFYRSYGYALLNKNKDQKNAAEAFKYTYHYATKSKDTSLIPMSYYYFADYFREIENYTEAEKYFNASLRPLSVFLKPSSREYSQIYFEYMTVLVKLGKYADAKPGVEALIYYYKTLDGEKSREYIFLSDYLSDILQYLGEYQKALEIKTKLVEEAKYLEIKDTANYIESFNSLGDVYREISRYDMAFQNFKKGKQEFFRLKVKNRHALASLENNIGLCYKSYGNIKEAEESFNTALNIYKEIGETESDDYCVTLNNKGDLFRELGRYGLASEILLKSLEIKKKYSRTNTKSYANTLNNLGLVYLDAGYYDEALKRTLEAKEVYAALLGESHQFYGNCLNNLSSLYLHLKDFKRAEETKLKALDIIEKSVGKNHFRYASFLISTTQLYLRTNQLVKAEKSLKEALLLVEKNLGKNHDLYARSQLALAEVYAMTNRFEQAGQLYFESLDFYSNQLNNYFDAMSEENQAHYLNFIEPAFQSYNMYLLNYKISQPVKDLDLHIKRALHNQMLLKSLLSKKAARLQQKVLGSNDQAMIKIYQEWIIAKNALVNNSKSTEPAFDDNELIRKAAGLENTLKAKFGDFAKTEKVSYEDLKKALSDKEAAIELFRVYEWINDSVSSKKYGAIVVSKNSLNPELIICKNGEQLEEKCFDHFSKCIDDQLTDSLSYIAYFKELEGSLKNINKVYVSADGIFQKINLSGLYNTSTKKYVQENYEVCNISNISTLVNKKNAVGSADLSASLFGYPDYEYDLKNKSSKVNKPESEMVAKRYGLNNLAKLPGTKAEVEIISKELKTKGWKVNVFTAENANEENLRKINSPNVLHIATHGYYLKDLETTDKLFLGFDSKNLKDNSFLRSGIILAGVGPATGDSLNTSSENDGIFTASEATVLNLSKTQLVVLSACQTGLGDNMGSQGVAGLQRSFAIAGAKNIMMSLWPVDDNATQFLMTEFYKNYVETQNAEEAFRKAQTEVKNKYPHPYYWAAFVLLKTFN